MFDHVATNPPYLAAAVADPSPDPSKALATVESSADLARWLDRGDGRPETGRHVDPDPSQRPAGGDRGHLVRLGWGDVTVKRLPPAARVLVRARRGRRAVRRKSPPLVLHRPDGGYTDEAEAILRHAAPLAF